MGRSTTTLHDRALTPPSSHSPPPIPLLLVPCGTLSPDVSVDAAFVFFSVLESVFLLCMMVVGGDEQPDTLAHVRLVSVAQQS